MANLPQVYANRALTGAQTAKGDLFYGCDVSRPSNDEDFGITRQELARAVAEDFKEGRSKYLTPFLGNITALTGGGANALDGILDGLVLADVQIPFCVDVSITDGDARFKLRAKAGGEVEDGANFISPDNAAFNAYIFVRIR